jgi:hypothetical protein
MPVLVCHIGWMAAYEGLIGQPDQIVGGGAWVRKHNDGGETCNFVQCDDGYVYGHVETSKGKIDRPIYIEGLGAKLRAEFVDHVDVVWTATDPKKKGRWVVGWYRDARVYRERVPFKKPPSAQHRLETPKPDYRVRAKAGNAVVIPLKQRNIPLGRGKGWIGQANWWFAELSSNPAVRPFLRKVRAVLDNGLADDPVSRGSRGGGRWGGKTDPQRNAQVEQAAIEEVRKHYAGHTVKSVEKDNLGWDLEARRKSEKSLRLEVKGLFGNELQVGLTPREYRAFKAHTEGTMTNYRLCVVTHALSGNPKLVIFRFDQGKRGWVDDRSHRPVAPTIKPQVAAIVSLT